MSSDVTGVLPVARGGTATTSSTGTNNNVLSDNPTITTPAISNPAITGGGSWTGSPSITTPTISSFTNSQHDHTNAAGGGSLGVNSVGSNQILAGAVTPEELLAGTGTTWPWLSYTPTVTLSGGVTNGNATIVGSYKQTGKTVNFQLKYTLGNTTDFSTLTGITFSLPVTSTAVFGSTTSGGWCWGDALIGGAHYGMSAISATTTTAQLIAYATGSSYLTAAAITSAVPGSWANGSTWFLAGAYEAA